MSIRRATHAGSWYTGDAKTLSRELDEWLAAVDTLLSSARAIIVPHAGYRYSGPTAAYGYRHLDPSVIKRIFVLGPSHHAYLSKCGLSPLAQYETPLGNLMLDKEVIKELYATGLFEYLSLRVEEEEHSLEMHLPYIAKVMGKREFTIVPIMIGNVSKDEEKQYGELLCKYLDDPNTAFVVSSDFCHWGKRFDYTPYDSSLGPIWKSIEAMDQTALRIIEERDPQAFTSYLKQTKNTICGRHPIAVLLWAISHSPNQYSLRAAHYEQSSRCMTNKDSSVSYAVVLAAPGESYADSTPSKKPKLQDGNNANSANDQS